MQARPKAAPRSLKLPKSLRLPRMQPWFFYDTERLIEIQRIIDENFEAKKLQLRANMTRDDLLHELLPRALIAEREEVR